MTTSQPWADLVTESEILALHAEIMEVGGGAPGGVKTGCVEGSIGAAWNAEYYALDPEDESARIGLTFAACLLFYLVKNHCFVDGNKRIGLAAAHAALTSLGLTIDVTDDELVTYITDIAASRVSRSDDVVRWIAERVAELE